MSHSLVTWSPPLHFPLFPCGRIKMANPMLNSIMCCSMKSRIMWFIQKLLSRQVMALFSSPFSNFLFWKENVRYLKYFPRPLQTSFFFMLMLPPHPTFLLPFLFSLKQITTIKIFRYKFAHGAFLSASTANLYFLPFSFFNITRLYREKFAEEGFRCGHAVSCIEAEDSNCRSCFLFI